MAKVFENLNIKTPVTFSGNISSLTTFPVVTVTECETLIISNILKHFSFALEDVLLWITIDSYFGQKNQFSVKISLLQTCSFSLHKTFT